MLLNLACWLTTQLPQLPRVGGGMNKNKNEPFNNIIISKVSLLYVLFPEIKYLFIFIFYVIAKRMQKLQLFSLCVHTERRQARSRLMT